MHFNQIVKDTVSNKVKNDTQSGVSSIIKKQQDKIRQIRDKIDDKEAEVERLGMEISELSRRIYENTDSNNVQNAKGTYLKLRILEIR
jgi:peptidoglycan hydrolase CwlO-like protein